MIIAFAAAGRLLNDRSISDCAITLFVFESRVVKMFREFRSESCDYEPYGKSDEATYYGDEMNTEISAERLFSVDANVWTTTDKVIWLLREMRARPRR